MRKLASPGASLSSMPVIVTVLPRSSSRATPDFWPPKCEVLYHFERHAVVMLASIARAAWSGLSASRAPFGPQAITVTTLSAWAEVVAGDWLALVELRALRDVAGSAVA